ncbi:hypothetical protein GGR21_002430 [Dysgonomonas hofstadii]|uniref:Uncharacterized protein n=1 Tax=Dysgonomonas hofstadii TaxID=637886 RepID=A0A840CS99_9BACT|nr:hypothetical protein [Dysgonomonas hofstadii]MBB4036524.1 hypothetical protein [Dysgonomonas hofstadii]
MALAFEQILLIVLLVGIILIFLTRLFPDKKKDRSTETKKANGDYKPITIEIEKTPIKSEETTTNEIIIEDDIVDSEPSGKIENELLTSESNSITEEFKTGKTSESDAEVIIDNSPIEPETIIKSESNNYNSDIKKISLEGHNLRNIQERDYYLFYHKDTDSYYHNKEYLLTPVRDIIGGFFPFNLEEKARKKAIQENCSIQEIKDKWKHDSSLGKELGRHLHMQIENYFQNKKVEMKYSFSFNSPNKKVSDLEYDISKEFSIFKNLVEKEIKPNIYKTDWLIYSPEHEVIGSVDLIFKDADGSYTMCDWIRSNKLFDEERNVIPVREYGVGLHGMNKTPSSEYHKACLKQNIHRFILEKYYNLKIGKMALLILHPDFSKYYNLAVLDMQKEAEYMLQNKHLVVQEN